MSILLKGVNGFLEILGGIVYLLVTSQAVISIIYTLTQHELLEDPRDRIANVLRASVSGISLNTKLFVTIYLFAHGIIKLFLVIALLRRKLWAYPAAVVTFLAFLAYQGYQYALTPSLGLVFLSVLDIVVIVLTILEYKRIRVSG